MLSLNIEKERLEGAPTFKKDEWASFDDMEFEEVVHGYYGLEEGPMIVESAGKSFLRGTYKASLFMGKSVLNAQGEELGQIRDMVAGEEGRIRYVVVSHSGGLFGMGSKLTPIPWGAMKFSNEGFTATLDMEKGQFLGAPSFAGGDWRKFDDPEWDETINAYYRIEKGD
jgi:sporulation protein YlmC with PRC-barrel domain